MKHIILFLIGYLFFFSCDTKSDTKDIGVILPLSGTHAKYGKSAQNGYELAAAELNDLHNQKINLVFEDDKAQPKEAMNAFLKFQSQDFPIVMGLISSPTVLSVAPVAEKNKTVLFSSGASSPLISEAGDYIFRDVPSDLLEASLMAEFAYGELGYKKVAIIYINNDYGIGVNNEFKNKFNKLGGTIVSDIAYNANLTDFRTSLAQIKASNPDALYFIGYKELGYLVKQAMEMNINIQYLSNALFEDPEVLKISGKASENLIFSTFYFDVNSKEEDTKNFVAKYRKKYGLDPDGYAVAAYDAVRVLFKAIGNEAFTPENIKNSLYNLGDFNGLLGKFSFDKKGDVLLPVKLKTVKDGKFINYAK